MTALLPGTDWATLTHARGSAVGTLADLFALLHEDPEVRAASLGRPGMSVLHQGSLYSATAPAGASSTVRRAPGGRCTMKRRVSCLVPPGSVPFWAGIRPPVQVGWALPDQVVPS
ncbi:hypothetical protein PV392_02290 [Streptomyces sp. ME03-5709C]|nr:hypothetical protein [Streptomyces sp. ME03-5709C]